MEQLITRKYVDALPLIEVNVAGTKRSVRYDETNGKIYGLDENGKWTGQVSDYRLPTRVAKEAPPAAATPLPIDNTAVKTNSSKADQRFDKPTEMPTFEQEDTKPGKSSTIEPPAVSRPIIPDAPSIPDPPSTPVTQSLPSEPLAQPKKTISPTAPYPSSHIPSKDSPSPAFEKMSPISEKPIGAEEYLRTTEADTSGERKKSKRHKKEKSSSNKSGLKIFLYVLLGFILVCCIIFTTFGGKLPSFSTNQSTTVPDNTNSTLPISATETSPTKDPISTDSGNNNEIDETIATNAHEQTEVPDATNVSESTDMIQVLSPVNAIIPGEKLTTSHFEVSEITESDYRTYSASMGLYTGKDLPNIEGLVAIKYIPAGKYLTFEDIGRTFGAINPWEADTAGYSLVTLPVSVTSDNLSYLNWGNTIDLTITVQTKQTNTNTDTEGEPEATPDGLEHESSIVESMVIDTYKLTNIKIADIQNESAEGLFPRYYSIGSIPSVFQAEYLLDYYQDPTGMHGDIPAYIVVCLTEDQAELIGNLPIEALSVTMSNPVSCSVTALQNEVYSLINDAQTVITQAWKTVWEETNG